MSVPAAALFSRRAVLVGATAATVAPSRAAERRTLFVSDRNFPEHDPGPGLPDRPERVRAILSALEAPRFASLRRFEAPPAASAALLAVHSQAYLQALEQASPREGVAFLARDVALSAGTVGCARRSAGGALLAVDAVMRGEAKNAFVASRPPGHHARANQAMGYCYLNNAAIAARRARIEHGAERVAIVDFDVHHGNGVEEIFWNDRDTLYCSTHQSPLYPFTGALTDAGAHDNIVNAPLRKGDGGAQFREALTSRVLPRLAAFSPDLVILCAGFDAHLHDPLGGLRFIEEDFRDVTLRVMEIAALRCGGRIVSLLEGGYAPADLAASVAAHVDALIGA